MRTFGKSKAAEVLAEILAKNENSRQRRYVGSTLNEFCTFLRNIRFIKEKNLILGKKFAKYELEKKLSCVKGSVLTQELKNFTSNVLCSKYRDFCGFNK